MRRRIYVTRWFWARIFRPQSEFFLFKKICVHHLCTARNWSFSIDNAEKKVDCPTLVTRLEPLMHHYLLPHDMFHVKRPKLSQNKKWINNPLFVRAGVTSVFPDYQTNSFSLFDWISQYDSEWALKCPRSKPWSVSLNNVLATVRLQGTGLNSVCD